ncbi:hypothetical protein [Sporolactobacillus inulinus]|uniref:Uncharacterized protein n=1 Tax=Sporolactobacillus inulinus CASD TaxID=1069536 RepID=A0A0U1QMH3_9BACL|nr:hypothetical protein [Sporolactobacillus inulinus]KLI02010.1 hypothetical protein SINU_10410 [Sporolactobacillus inulinus CASD]GEB77840.1 hypothetical protein SIN01_21850 [Sporolactobacillus inulinus]
MIPNNLNKSHILLAVEEMENKMIVRFHDENRDGFEKHHLMMDGIFYPLGGIVMRAIWYATQTEPQLGDYRNSDKIKKAVEALGFIVTSERLIYGRRGDQYSATSVDFGWTLYRDQPLDL